MSEANVKNKDKKDANHHSGSTPISYLMAKHMAEGSLVPFNDTYRDVYVHPENDKVAENLEKLMQLAEEQFAEKTIKNSDTPREQVRHLDVPTQTTMFEKVLGVRRGTEIRGLGHIGVRELTLTSTSTSRARSGGVEVRIQEVQKQSNVRIREVQEQSEAQICEFEDHARDSEARLVVIQADADARARDFEARLRAEMQAKMRLQFLQMMTSHMPTSSTPTSTTPSQQSGLNDGDSRLEGPTPPV